MMPFDVAAELKTEIAKEDDKDRRTLLMLLLGVLEANMEGLAAISKKIDSLISDEQMLRATVLNGHAENHDRDHEFVGHLFSHREAAAEERRWVRERMGSRCAEACTWAEQKMRDEKDAEKTALEDAKADKRAARDAVIRLVVTALASSAATVAGVLWAIK
jgi:hypothetical protein